MYAFQRGHVYLLFATAVFWTGDVAASPPALPPTVMDRGGLYVPGEEPGTVTPAPLLKTEIDAVVSGPVVRYTMRHTFVNASDSWTEAIYTYPLPTDSAVDHLSMRVGDREITGRIAEKQVAKRTYDAAKAAGKRAGLVVQHRPNLFSTSLANIGPGEHVVVEIGFQEHLKMTDGGFRMRMPLVVGPRYIGGQPVAGFQSTGWAPPTDRVADADKITPPVRTEAEGPGNPVELTVDLDAGFPIAHLESPSHIIEIEKVAEGHVRLHLQDSVPADRDFALVWRAADGSAPAAGLFSEQFADTRYALLMLSPPPDPANDNEPPSSPPPREVMFLLDTSGSMQGASIDQAKGALRLALDRLRPEDSFRIVRFSNAFAAFRPFALKATKGNVSDAKDWVTALEADGGTEVVAALAHVLALPRSNGLMTQIVLVTDGAVGDEEMLFRTIEGGLGAARLFTVGIGSAPNGYLMTRAATAGRGSYTYIQTPDEVAARMTELFARLERPALVDVALRWRGTNQPVAVWPDPVPDLFYGEPVTVLAALPPGVDGVDVSGRIGGAVWRTHVPLDAGQARAGIAKLWGREKIKTLSARMTFADDADAVKAEITRTALDFGLVSRYTSLLVVDDRPARPEDATLSSAEVPTNLPGGWSRPHVTGEGRAMPIKAFDRADPTLRRAMRSGTALAQIPQTATPGPLALIVGGLVLLIGVALRGRHRIA